MPKINFPPVIAQALLLGVAAILQYLLNNVGQLNIPPVYVPIATFIAAAVLKMIQEKLPKKPEQATPRAMGAPEKPAGYWRRVLVG